MALWRYPGRDITGVIARSEKFAGTVEKVIEIVTNNFYFLNRRLSSISTKPGSTCYFHNFSKKNSKDKCRVCPDINFKFTKLGSTR